MTKATDENIDEIIEILSSPEKSPFKTSEPSDLTVTSPSSLKKARRQLLRDEVSPFKESICISSETEDESDSLPSIDSPLFEVPDPSSSPLPSSSPSSSLEALPISIEPENVYYQNDPLMPVYKRSSKGMDTKEAVQTLLCIQNENAIAKTFHHISMKTFHLCTASNSLVTGRMFYVTEWDHGNKLESKQIISISKISSMTFQVS